MPHWLQWLRFAAAPAAAEEVAWYDGSRAVTYSVQKKVDPVVEVALQMFASDMKAVTGREAERAGERDAAIWLVELDKAPASVRRRLEKGRRAAGRDREKR